MNLALLKEKIEASRQRVTLAESELERAMRKLTEENGGEKTFMSMLLEHAFTTLRDARMHLSDLNALLAGEQEARPAERACPACNRLIRANAKLCGYCWRKLA